MRKMLFAASMLSFAAVTPAFAETIRVPYTAADLATEAGKAALYGKVADAANVLCKNGFSSNGALVNETAIIKDCVREAVSEAILDTREPELIGYHRAVLASQKAGPGSATLAMR